MFLLSSTVKQCRISPHCYSRLEQNAAIARRLNAVTDLGCRRLSEEAQVAFARSLQVYERLKATHYVFHHGQPSLRFLPFNIFKKQLLDPTDSKKENCFLRHPANIRHLSSTTHTVEWYISHIIHENLEEHNDRVHRSALIAADGHLASTEIAESALAFFSSNCHNYTSIAVLQAAVSEVAKVHFPDIVVREQVVGELYRLETSIEEAGGVLYTICVPKENFRNCGYLSIPFGMAYPIENKGVEEFLEEMQITESPQKKMPQVRLLSHLLDANGAKTFMFAAIRDERLEELKVKVQEIIERWGPSTL